MPLADWLRGPLASLVDERLGEGPVIEEGWLERGRLRALTAEHRGGADHSAILWPALILALWMGLRAPPGGWAASSGADLIGRARRRPLK